MTTVICVNHTDRPAMGYCAGCGKALCASCLVRLSTGNYCAVCAETPDHRPPSARGRRARTWLWVGLAAVVTLVLLLSRLL